MQNAQTLFLQTVENLIMEDEVAMALEELIKFDEKVDAGIREDAVLLLSRLRALEKNVKRGLVSPTDSDYLKTSNLIKFSVLDIVKDIPKKVELYAKKRTLDGFQFDISDKVVGLEKIIGSKDNLVTIGWVEKALQVSKAVCRVVRADQEKGTGFITKDGYLYTNHHVLETAEEAAGAIIEFNYEVGASGNVKPLFQYKLDPSDFKTSPVGHLDCSRVKIIDSADKPLSEWGFLEIDTAAAPAPGDPVVIIQHSAGGDKRMALRANEVLAKKEQFLYYTTDTEPGSSGSPVFNRDWKVVALHHAAKPIDGRDANEGILFKDILNFLNS